MPISYEGKGDGYLFQVLGGHDLVSLRGVDELVDGYVLKLVSLVLEGELASYVVMLFLMKRPSQVLEEKR